jgi:hypothetical protein
MGAAGTSRRRVGATATSPLSVLATRSTLVRRLLPSPPPSLHGVLSAPPGPNGLPCSERLHATWSSSACVPDFKVAGDNGGALSALLVRRCSYRCASRSWDPTGSAGRGPPVSQAPRLMACAQHGAVGVRTRFSLRLQAAAAALSPAQPL